WAFTFGPTPGEGRRFILPACTGRFRAYPGADVRRQATSPPRGRGRAGRDRAGRERKMPRPTAVRGLGPGTHASVAARRIVAARLKDVLLHEEPLLCERTDDGVHDMRVACRRLRAALQVFAFLGDVDEVEAEVKRLQD